MEIITAFKINNSGTDNSQWQTQTDRDMNNLCTVKYKKSSHQTLLSQTGAAEHLPKASPLDSTAVV